jgi:hypothetical protein
MPRPWGLLLLLLLLMSPWDMSGRRFCAWLSMLELVHVQVAVPRGACHGGQCVGMCRQCTAFKRLAPTTHPENLTTCSCCVQAASSVTSSGSLASDCTEDLV